MHMTAHVFRFDNIQYSRDGDVLSCNCAIAADMPFFNGHFPGMPIMPAIAQIEMIHSLLQQKTDWNAVITGGSGLKFSGRIKPGDRLAIQLQRMPSGDISFSLRNNAITVSKGTLKQAGVTLD
jgi:3-hydroxyacyl-[acyl-carrier-protein] dehydratase